MHLLVKPLRELSAMLIKLVVRMEEMQRAMRKIIHDTNKIRRETHPLEPQAVCFILSLPCSVCSCVATHFNGTFLRSRKKHPKARLVSVM